MLSLGKLPYFEKWILLGVLIGISVGVFSIAFTVLLNLFQFLFIHEILHVEYPKPLGEGGKLIIPPFHPNLLIPGIVGLGGLIAGILIYRISPETAGGGLDFAITTYHKLQGKIRKRVAFVELFTSTIILGSGGSAGDLGPMGLIGGSLGSTIAQLLDLTPEDMRKAVAVGIGAGIGAIFKAPIGGALLSAEILYRRDLEPDVILPSMVSAAIAYSIYGSYVGFQPLFGTYPFCFSPLRLPFYALFGVIIGVLSIFFVTLYSSIASAFKRLKIRSELKPAIGGILVGLLVLLFPEVLGTGYGWDNLLEFGVIPSLPLPCAFLLLIAIVKMISSSLTIGSGGSGGIEAPAFEIGAFLGSSYGLITHNLFPTIVPVIAPFVVIGMLTMFGAAAKAPLSVMIIITEMTSSLQLLPGEMIAVAIAYAISGKYSLYPSQYPTRRDSPAHRSEYEIPVMEEIRIKEVPLTELKIKENDDITLAKKMMEEEGYLSLPVVDNEGNFVGAIFYRDIVNKQGKVRDYAVRGVPYVTPSANIEHAWEIITRTKSRWVAVVDKGKLLGVVTLDDLFIVYEKELRKIHNHE
ncbi:chloride channel protein [Acidianus sp. HS-5]|nr:chloride channel protein [Acidianus sp. HS-5]